MDARTIGFKLAATFIGAAIVVAWPHRAAAQGNPPSFELGVQLSSAVSSQFDSTDLGFGGRLSWHPGQWVGVESEVDLYPRGFPSGVPFSRRRVEGLFGVTFGPALGRARPFAKLRSGFLNVREAPGPLVCILIYPPPLSCELAAGATLLAFDVGGGIEILASKKTFARIEAGDRLIKYPGPVFDRNGKHRDASFFSHDFRFAAGGGLRF